MIPKFLKQNLHFTNTSLGILLTAAFLLVFFFKPTFIQRVDLLASDMRFLMRNFMFGPPKPHPAIVIAAIDEKSIDRFGRWPWPYTIQARLVNKLVSYGARVIGYDVVFSSSDTTAGIKNLKEIKTRLSKSGRAEEDGVMAYLDRAIKEADHDQIFARALKKSRRTILGYFFHFSKNDIAHLSESEMERYLGNIRNSKYNAIKKSPGMSLKNVALPRAWAVESSIAPLSKAARGGGFFSVQADADGAIRRYPLIVKYRELVEVPGEQDYLFAPLAVRLTERFYRGSTIFWIDPLGVEKVAISGRKKVQIPTNEYGEMIINYLGPWGTFPRYSISDIIEGNHELAPPSAFRRKVVLVGPSAVALADLRVTPFDKSIPGVTIHASVIDNILKKNFLQEPWWSDLYTMGGILFLGLLATLLMPRLGALWGGVGVLIALAGVLVTNQYLFVQYGWWLNLAYPFLTTVGMYGGMTLFHYVVEEREKRFIQSAFGTYLSPKVVDEIAENPDFLKLGGERKEITAFFSDVAGFTSVSETMTPEDLVHLLNEYLTEMTDIILNYDGTVDKYEGDAIVAFFGAPHPMEDHAKRACLVCLEMQEKMEGLRAAWRERGQKELYVRIGLNTGPAVVGNMGSRTRMDYTMMGDTVNTAARFEGANKAYGSSILIGEQTYLESTDAIETRRLDIINVVGKAEPVPIYEVVAKKGELDETKKKVLDFY